MPNWCSNYASFNHKDPEQIKKLIAAAKEDKLFETFVPFPNGEWDYGWAVENWGTKWDASNQDVQEDGNNDASVSFDTAWGPPIEFYNKMTELGFDVDATYYEEGMQFAGHYTSDNGDYSVEYNFDNPDWREEVEDDEVLDILEGLYESWLDWQEMNEEDEEEVETEEEEKK